MLQRVSDESENNPLEFVHRHVARVKCSVALSPIRNEELRAFARAGPPSHVYRSSSLFCCSVNLDRWGSARASRSRGKFGFFDRSVGPRIQSHCPPGPVGPVRSRVSRFFPLARFFFLPRRGTPEQFMEPGDSWRASFRPDVPRFCERCFRLAGDRSGTAERRAAKETRGKRAARDACTLASRTEPKQRKSTYNAGCVPGPRPR